MVRLQDIGCHLLHGLTLHARHQAMRWERGQILSAVARLETTDLDMAEDTEKRKRKFEERVRAGIRFASRFGSAAILTFTITIFLFNQTFMQVTDNKNWIRPTSKGDNLNLPLHYNLAG